MSAPHSLTIPKIHAPHLPHSKKKYSVDVLTVPVVEEPSAYLSTTGSLDSTNYYTSYSINTPSNNSPSPSVNESGESTPINITIYDELNNCNSPINSDSNNSEPTNTPDLNEIFPLNKEKNDSDPSIKNNQKGDILEINQIEQKEKNKKKSSSHSILPPFHFHSHSSKSHSPSHSQSTSNSLGDDGLIKKDKKNSPKHITPKHGSEDKLDGVQDEDKEYQFLRFEIWNTGFVTRFIGSCSFQLSQLHQDQKISGWVIFFILFIL